MVSTLRRRLTLLCLALLPAFLAAQYTTGGSLIDDHARLQLDLPQGISSYTLDGLNVGQAYEINYHLIDRSINSSMQINGVVRSPLEFVYLRPTTSAYHIQFDLERQSIGWLSVSCTSCPRATETARPSQRNTLAMTYRDDLSPEQLIRDVFIGGSCFDIFNIEYHGMPQSIGVFENGDSTIGMSSGVIMSTGIAADIVGPNDTHKHGTALPDLVANPDPDLALLDTSQVTDYALFEFDFVPTQTKAEFRFAFASEEYCDFIQSAYNDNFGFIVSGPDLDGPFENNGVNIALVPNTNEVVSINTINPFTNSQFYIDNIPNVFRFFGDISTAGARCEPSTAEDESTNELFEPNGYTTIITAELDVVACETYHIKLALADFGDRRRDSWIFLEANSFDAGEGIDLVLDLPGEDNDQEAYEGCAQHVVITRPVGSDIDEPVVIVPIIGGTAVEGVDYAPLPDSFILAPGDTILEIEIDAFSDGINEGAETIEITYRNPCECADEMISFNINDYPPPTVFIEERAFCQTGVEINPTISGGVPPYTYAWSTGEDSETIISQPGISTYAVSITDACGTMAMDSMTLVPPDATDFSFTQEDIAGCDDILPADVELRYTGSAGVDFIIRRPDGALDTIMATSSPVIYTASLSGSYEIQGVLVDGCPTEASDTLEVIVGGITTAPTVTGDPCMGDDAFLITMNATSDAPPLTYTWSSGETTMDDFIEQQSGDYFVTITDGLGCTIIDTFSLRLELNAMIDVSQPECGDVLGTLSLGDGQANLDYQLLPDGVVMNTWPFTLPAGIHDIALFGQNGCSDTIGVEIVTFMELTVDLPLVDSIFEGGSTQLDPVVNRDLGAITGITWTPPTDLVTADQLQPIASPTTTTSYILTVTDTNDCSSSDTILIYVIPTPTIYLPTAFSPNNDGINDLFYPQSGSGFTIVEEFAIFNRWGVRVMRRVNFPINDIAYGWDGTSSGELLDPGLYTYYIIARREDGALFRHHGEVNMIR